MSTAPQQEPCDTIWQAQTGERVAREISKFALRHNKSDPTRPVWREGCASEPKTSAAHNESDLTRTEWREGYASDLKKSTALQRERSDPHKVTRGLRKRSQNEHRATTRAICHAQSHDRVARAHVRFSQNIAHTTNMKTMSYLGLDLFFVEVCKVLRLPRKMNPGHPKCCTCHNGIISLRPKSTMTTVSQNETFDPFKASSKFTRHCTCHEKWPPKPPLVLNHARCRKCHACPALKMSGKCNACHTLWT